MLCLSSGRDGPTDCRAARGYNATRQTLQSQKMRLDFSKREMQYGKAQEAASKDATRKRSRSAERSADLREQQWMKR